MRSIRRKSVSIWCPRTLSKAAKIPSERAVAAVEVDVCYPLPPTDPWEATTIASVTGAHRSTPTMRGASCSTTCRTANLWKSCDMAAGSYLRCCLWKGSSDLRKATEKGWADDADLFVAAGIAAAAIGITPPPGSLAWPSQLCGLPGDTVASQTNYDICVRCVHDAQDDAAKRDSRIASGRSASQSKIAFNPCREDFPSSATTCWPGADARGEKTRLVRYRP